ncbi:hypothetical protein GCM10009840_24110 [Pseudolysinimonas kribbensis]|uniref:DUF4190 domain-containing protein n=1 Tax=Pseudolysinimonas kribbensis TaxID=433641 RepID=A0ABQ6KEG6_9MICO|nr:hypothetical protein [Pseudolysinimonas kribbensis]GMA96827.1 hypothetical protein GCM10025881_36510 [Pseudolysinimonas kribbensis]
MLPGVFAIVFGILGIARSRRLERLGLGPQGRSRSVAGLVLGCVGVVLGVLLVVVVVVLPRARPYPS